MHIRTNELKKNHVNKKILSTTMIAKQLTSLSCTHDFFIALI